jgi:hypothetical protein
MAPLDWLPLSDFVPDQLPDAEHSVALVLFQESIEVPPAATVVGLALSATVGAALEIDTVAACIAVPPAPVHVSSNSVFLVIASVVSEPFVATEPVQPPDAVQLVAPLELQVRMALAPGATVVGLAESDATGGVVAAVASACDVLPVVTPLLTTVELIPHAERIAALVKPKPRMSSRRGKQTQFMQISLILHDIVFAFLTSANVSRFANDWQRHVSQFTDGYAERTAGRNPRRSIRSRV